MQFTVAVTVYKTPEYLPRAIQTILAQTVTDWELLIYSDGRCKTTREVVRQIEGDVDVRYRELRRRRGSYGNHLRRLTLEEGRGDHVCYVGHDCLVYPTYLETHARTIAGDPRAVSVVKIDYWKNTERRATQPEQLDLARAGEGEIDLMCVAYPRLLSLEVGCFDADMERIRCADYLSFDRLRQASPPILADAPEQGSHF